MSKVSNLKELLVNSANLYNDKILYEKRKISYKEFFNNVNFLGTALLNSGLKNKRIAILSENRYEWELTYFAICCGVGTVVPLDKTLPQIEIMRIVKRANVEVVFCSKKYEKMLNEINEELMIKIISFDSTNFELLIENGKNAVENNEDKKFINLKVNNNKTNFIMFTSGTSNKSKAVMLSHRNICSNIISVSQVFSIDKNDKILSILPLNHALEGVFCFLLSIYKGASRIHCNNHTKIIEYIKKYNITFMCGVPVVYERLYNQKEELKECAPQMKMFMCGGAKLNSILEKKYEEIGIKLVQGYGMTETGPVISMEDKERYKFASVGTIIPGVEVKILNKDEMRNWRNSSKK